MGFYGVFSGGSGGGGGNGAIVAAGVANLANGISTVTINYDVTLALAVPPVITVVNTLDANPILLTPQVSAFTTTSFTLRLGAVTDSTNYKITYIVSGAV